MRNRLLAIVGAVLIVAGGVSLYYRGIPYKSRDVVIDLGPVTATAVSERTWPIPPIVGGLAIACGVVLVVVGSRREAK